MPRFLRQFGLRSLLLFCTLAAVCFGLWRWHMSWVDRQFELAAQIGEKDGQLRWETWGPAWLHETFGSRYFSQIVRVDWQHKRIKDEDLELLRELSTLEQLYIAGNPITDDGLAVLDDLPRIKTLAIWNTGLTDESLRHVGKLQSLEVLDMHGTAMTEQGLEHLRDLDQLKLLRQDLVLTDKGIQRLASFPQLQLETLRGKQLSEASIRWVVAQKQLTSIRLDHTQGDRWADAVAELPALTYLDVRNGQIQYEQLEAILLANRLKTLELWNVPVGDAALSRSLMQGSLKRVDFRYTNVTPGAILRVFGAHGKQMYLTDGYLSVMQTMNGPHCQWGGSFEADDWQHLAHCVQMTMLEVSATVPNDHRVDGLKSLAALDQIVFHQEASDAALRALSELPNLRSIILHNVDGLTADGFRALKNAPKLKQLSLAATQLTDDQLAGVSEIEGLTNLDLNFTPITDAGIRHLSSLVNLQDLTISNCRNLTDEALPPLVELPKLQRLTATGMPIGKVGREYLSGIRAAVYVDNSGSNQTRGGMLLGPVMFEGTLIPVERTTNLPFSSQ
ncbi:hypothetical protein [Blastopirellula marina]|uniref:Leucine Rich repeats (2 copies) n=1 Tax=Blastopirellula marina TaxID=124 RepID=A0A2S8GLI2_9BACT|nr:hypothetical protein [Blastopirellula marina]PQO45293.1 hypothetical protein C5Y93_15170 [Blastopirellula marina]